MLEPDREGDRPGGKIEQIAIEMEIGQWQLKLAGAMQSNVDPAYCRLRVLTLESKEGIKRCGRARIQQHSAYACVAYHATMEVFLVVPGIPETQFPIPILEVIPNLSHLSA